jgi:hypothetical protein
LITAAAAAPTSAVPPAITGVLTFDAACATACPAPLVLVIAVSFIASAPFRFWAVDRDCDRGRDAAALLPFARLAFELDRFAPELDRFERVFLFEPEEFAREPLRPVELLLLDFVACAISFTPHISCCGGFEWTTHPQQAGRRARKPSQPLPAATDRLMPLSRSIAVCPRCYIRSS